MIYPKVYIKKNLPYGQTLVVPFIAQYENSN